MEVAANAQSASAAFAELSELSSGGYAPKFVPGAAPVVAAAPTGGPGLTRRQPKHEAKPVAQAPLPVAVATPRDAEAVRARLSGFRAGVERGRQAPAEQGQAGSPASSTEPAAPTQNDAV